MRKQLFLFLLFLSPLTLLAQKTMLTYNVVVYVEQKTADYFGGNLAMQDSVKGQLAKVNAKFNAQANLNHNYTFTAASFVFYTDGADDNNTMAYHGAPAEPNNQYRMIYNAFPSLNNYKIVFEIGWQSVLFSYRESASSNGSMFGRVMTNTIAHELGHARGAWDLYAGNIDASNNLANTTKGWKNPTPSLMNDLFTSTNIDKHSAYMINRAATLYGTSTFTDAQRSAMTNAAFPNTISLKVLNSSGTAQSGATVKLFGNSWYGEGGPTISATPTYTYTTDASGNVNWVGATNNPFNVSNGKPQYNTFFISVTYGGVTKYGWMPLFDVSNAFIDGASSYTKTISLSSANTSPLVTIGNSGNLINFNTTDFSIPVFAYDLDGTIASVKLYDNGVYFADATFDGSNIYWFLHYAGLTVGTHKFTAIATDNSGATTTSEVLQVDDCPLNVINVSLTSPVSTNTFTAPATVPFKAYASEGGGGISKVEYYNGATLLGTATVKPYAFNWTNVAAGTYSVTAKAYDLNSTPLTKSSAAVSITVSGAMPTVSITSPVNNATFTAPASVTINANAAEVGGTIAKVEFYNGATLLGTSTTSPYTYTWTNVPAGTYSLTAKAYDTKPTPLTKTSTAVSITVNPVMPTVSITSPANNATFTAPASVTINANAAEVGGTIAKVEFYNGATLLGTSTTSPYTYTWTNVPAGTYSLTAKAYDTKPTPLTKTSTAVSITVNPVMPTVSITSPANNATFTAPASVTINANAAEVGGTIAKVEFYNGATLLGTSTTSPYTYTWTNVPAGTYSLTAKAYDTKPTPLTKTSTAVSITVNGGSCTAQQWNASSAYTGGTVVQYLGIKYVAHWWNQGKQPDLNNGPVGTGKDWLSQGTCTSRIAIEETENHLSAYPNPSSDQVNFNLGNTQGEATLTLYDTYGTEVAKIFSGNADSGQEIIFSTNHLAKGIYTVSLISNSGVKALKLIIE